MGLSTAMKVSCQEQDSVTLGASYMNESYYSLENGEVQNLTNLNWDLAFDLSPYGGAIRLNRKTDVLFLYPGSSTDWSSLDTAGHLTWNQYNNGYESWSDGALNSPADISDPSDLGWGLYNGITHVTEGSRIFVIKLDDDSYRKLFVEQLAAGTYTFKYSNIDGTNEVNETIVKSDYTGKNFIHYSILNEGILDREPASADWDLVFTNYVLELAPGYFSGVTGVLTNSTFRAITVSESNAVPFADAYYDMNPFQSEINVIGYDWKTFNSGTFTYEIEDSLCYFIQDENENVWKLIFTGFSGGATGKIFFTKEQVTFAELDGLEFENTILYPVPANDNLYIKTNLDAISSISIYSVSGQLLKVYTDFVNEGEIVISTTDFNNGIHVVQITMDSGEIQNHKIIVQH